MPMLLYVLTGVFISIMSIINYRILGFNDPITIFTSIVLPLAIYVGSKRNISFRINGVTLYINIGGFIVPLVYCLELFTRMTLLYGTKVVVASMLCLIITFMSLYYSSRYIVGYGIGLPLLLPIVLVSSFTLIFLHLLRIDLIIAPPFATTIGILGTIIGVDMVKTIKISLRRRQSFELGGGGLFDVIVLSGFFSSHLTLILLIILGYIYKL